MKTVLILMACLGLIAILLNWLLSSRLTLIFEELKKERVSYGIIYASATQSDAMRFIPFFGSVPSVVKAADFIPE